MPAVENEFEKTKPFTGFVISGGITKNETINANSIIW